jgi:UPF0176 protein
MKYKILLFYKYVELDNLEEIQKQILDFCKKFNIQGRFIIAKEGINGTLEATEKNALKYIEFMNTIPQFKDIDYKISEGTGSAFPKLSVKVRAEIVSLNLGESDFSPNSTTGKYLEPSKLHEWINSNKEFYIVDMRNDYEYKVGYFANSILPPLKNFRELPKVLPKLKHLMDKTIVTVCTGGIRCEKASGFLVQNGFSDVYQLKGGIISYMKKYPNEDFKGKLYVFDGRVTMGFNTENEKHEIVSKCDKCNATSDNYVDCAYLHCEGHRHFICCEKCLDKNNKAYCSDKCKDSASVIEVPLHHQASKTQRP